MKFYKSKKASETKKASSVVELKYVEEVLKDDSGLTNTEHAFLLVTPNQTFALHTSQAFERDDWVDILCRLVNKKRDPKQIEQQKEELKKDLRRKRRLSLGEMIRMKAIAERGRSATMDLGNSGNHPDRISPPPPVSAGGDKLSVREGKKGSDDTTTTTNTNNKNNQKKAKKEKAKKEKEKEEKEKEKENDKKDTKGQSPTKVKTKEEAKSNERITTEKKKDATSKEGVGSGIVDEKKGSKLLIFAKVGRGMKGTKGKKSDKSEGESEKEGKETKKGKGKKKRDRDKTKEDEEQDIEGDGEDEKKKGEEQNNNKKGKENKKRKQKKGYKKDAGKENKEKNEAADVIDNNNHHNGDNKKKKDPNNNNNSENTQEKEEAKEVAGDAESASDPIDPKDTDSASLANGLLTENGNPASVKEEEGNLSQYLLSEHLTSPNDGFPCKKDLAQISLQDMAAQTNSLVSTLLQITSDMSDSERRAPLPRFYAVSAGTHIRTYTIFLL